MNHLKVEDNCKILLVFNRGLQLHRQTKDTDNKTQLTSEAPTHHHKERKKQKPDNSFKTLKV